MKLEWIEGSYCVCKLDAVVSPPISSALWNLTLTQDEISLVCEARIAPDARSVERGWIAFRVCGQIPFEQTGVIAAFASVLGENRIPMFVVSTFDTDYVLVRENSKQDVESVLAKHFA